MAKVADSAAAVVMRALGRYGSPALGVIHAERQNEAAKVAVVFGAAHIPAVVDYLTVTFRYNVENAVWLTVAHAPD